MQEAGVNRPFRFIYISGIAAERDQAKKPAFLPEYLSMRVSKLNNLTPAVYLLMGIEISQGEAENRLLAIAAESESNLEVCVAKPGWITAATFTRRSIMAFVMRLAVSMPSVTVTEISATMIDQVVRGFDKEPLVNDDLVRIGGRVLNAQV